MNIFLRSLSDCLLIYAYHQINEHLLNILRINKIYIIAETTEIIFNDRGTEMNTSTISAKLLAYTSRRRRNVGRPKKRRKDELKPRNGTRVKT